MIVVDTGVIAHLVVGGALSEAAEALLREDAAWAAPPIWRTELAAVLALHVRAERATADDARILLEEASALLAAEPVPDARDVLELALTTGCAAHACEFVAAAVGLGVRLVTTDEEVVKRFPGVAVLL